MEKGSLKTELPLKAVDEGRWKRTDKEKTRRRWLYNDEEDFDRKGIKKI